MERRAEGMGDERAGLVSLGLIMQLVGSIVAAYLVTRSLEPLLAWFVGEESAVLGDFSRGYDYVYDYSRFASPALHLALVVTGGIVRALLHRRAGSAMLYRHRGAFAGLCAYLAAAFVHTGLCLALFYRDSSGAMLQWSIAALVGAAWPTCLMASAARPGFRRALRGGPAACDDAAPDEVATLAIFLGLVGALVALFAVYSSVERFGAWDSIATGSTVSGSIAMVVICSLFLVRAIVQLGAGLFSAGRAADSGRTRSMAAYVMVGLVASGLAAAALSILLRGSLWTLEWYRRQGWMRTDSFSWDVILPYGLVAYLIALWPVLLRRFVVARKTASTTPAGEARRAGAALGALGWFSSPSRRFRSRSPSCR
jgi:hypothetical protein